jgi:molecular chaperone GrpE
MTEIKITSNGDPAGSDEPSVGAADSSARAFAHAEGSSAPTTGQATQTPHNRASGDGPRTSVPDDEIAGIEGDLDTPFGAQSELVKTAKQRDDYLALAQRTQADFENYRKRVARDAAQAQDRGVAKLAKELLPALDNLDRAIEAAEAEDPLLAGVRLVRTEIAAALARVGIEAFAPLGERFDPNQQEAMAQQPVEGAASGTVAEVYQDGYRMGDTIVRPARVLVAA